MTNTCSNESNLYVKATVTAVQPQTATIRLSAEQEKSCAQCQGKGGCRSLSLYQLIFAHKPLTIANVGYRQGQQLRLSFPNKLMSNSIFWLLGLPLLGFIVGVLIGQLHHELTAFGMGLLLTFGGYFIGNKHIKRQLQQELIISKVNQ